MTEIPVLATLEETTDLPEEERLRLFVQQQQAIIGLLAQQNQALEKQVKELTERISQLEEELRQKKKLSKKPQLKASKLNQGIESQQQSSKRPGSAKRSKKQGFVVNEERKIELEELPEGARFNGYREYDVQELCIKRNNIRFLLAEYVLEDGSVICAQLPPEYSKTGHYGPELVGYILHEHYQNRVPQPLIYQQLKDWKIDISVGQVNRILTEKLEEFHHEQASVLETGVGYSKYIHTDDTGARQGGKNGYCTVIGNEWFSYFASTLSKSRRNFLEQLHGNKPSYVLNECSRKYLQSYELGKKQWKVLEFDSKVLANSTQAWNQYLDSIGIVTPKAVRLVTEAALLGGLIEGGVSERLVILSDGAGQFNLLVHALCWVHAERAIRKLEGSTAVFRQNIEEVQTLLWDYYQELKTYPNTPSEQHKTYLSARFDEVFGRCYLQHPTLNNTLMGFRKNKKQLLRVLDFPDIPLHNNAAESDIREFVTRRKISGGTRNDVGRKARDTMVGLKKTCRKLGVCFWDYLLSRLRGDHSIPSLPELIKHKSMEHLQVGNPV